MNADRYGRWYLWAVAIVTIVVVAFSAAVLFSPLPPREFVLATGPPGSAYAESGERYRQILEGEGVRVRLRATAGALENLALLNDPESGVSAGFVQAGTTTPQDSPGLVSLGAVFHESFWLFCRCPSGGLGVQGLEGKTISIGPEGSATRAFALKLLALNDAADSRIRLLNLPPEEAADRLLAGTIDGAAFFTWWQAPVVHRLLASPDVNLIGFPRADAYVVLFPYLDKIVVPMGVGNLAANRPPEDVTVLRAKASVAVRRDLHPALQYVLLKAIHAASGGSAGFDPAGTFPAPIATDLPLSEEARGFYKSGPSLLQRYLPFWLAELIGRLAVGLLPIVGVLYPLWSIAPRAFGWYMNQRIYRHYLELKRLEREAQLRGDPAATVELEGRLAELERRVTELQAPAPFAAAKYQLKAHIRQFAESLRSRPHA